MSSTIDRLEQAEDRLALIINVASLAGFPGLALVVWGMAIGSLAIVASGGVGCLTCQVILWDARRQIRRCREILWRAHNLNKEQQ